MPVVRFLDTETTGFVDPDPVEIAFIDCVGPPHHMKIAQKAQEFYKPRKPIENGAMAVHHITNEDVAGHQKWDPESFHPGEGFDFLVGHSIDYDWNVIGKPEVRRICTDAMARHTWPEADSYKQSALLYRLYGGKAREMFNLKFAHGALLDIENCYHLFGVIVKIHKFKAWEEVWKFSEEARVPIKMPFGKHRGEKIADMPRSYKNWLLGQPDVDPYLRVALER